MGAFEEMSEKLDSTKSKKSILRESIFNLVTNWRKVDNDLELTQKSFQYFLSEHWNGETSLPKETYLATKERELNEREALLNGLSAKLESDKEEFKVVENMFLGRLREVGLTEERLELWERRVEEREKSVGTSKLWAPLMEDRKKTLEMKEREITLLREYLEFKEKHIGMLLNLSETRENELDKRERQLEVKRKFVEELQSSVKSLDEELGAMRKYSIEIESSVNSFEKELEGKGRYHAELELSVKSLEKGLEAKRKDILVAEQRLMECQSKRELLDVGIIESKRKDMEKHDVREKQLELKEKQCRSENELLEIGKKELEQKMKEFEDRKKASEIKDIEVRMRDLEHRNCAMKEIEVYEKKLKARENELEEVAQERLMEWQLKQKQCQSNNKALDIKIKEFEDRIKAFENRQEEFALKDKKVNDALEVAVELDGLDAHILLNGHKIHLSSPNEVSKALRLSGAPSFLVLSAMKVLYPPYLMNVDMRFEGSVGKSCILLLEQLIIISPLIQSQQRDDALKLATKWKDKISLGNTLEVLAFLYFLASFDIASSFDTDEVMKLFETIVVAEHAQIPDLCHRLGLEDKMYVSKSYIDKDQKEDEGKENPKCPRFEAQVQAYVSLEENPLTNLLKFLKGCNLDLSNESQIPMILKQSLDASELVLDALDFISDSKERKISVVKSVYHLLKQLASVPPKIKPCARKRASKFALDWKSTLLNSNSWEVFAFLLFVGVYGLFSSFGAKYVMSLLEVHSELVKETSCIIRILKLEHKATDLIMKLIGNKQQRIAFDYVYEFNLVDKIPPVALLKKHVLDSKLAATKCKNEHIATESLDGAISGKILTLKDVIKCILDHSLESEYSPDMLRQRITCLEVERENLKKCMHADITKSSMKLDPVENQHLGQERTRKRPASDLDFAPSPLKKMRHKNNDRSFFNVHPVPFAHQQAAHNFFTGDGRRNHWPYYDNPVPIPPIFFPPYH